MDDKGIMRRAFRGLGGKVLYGGIEESGGSMRRLGRGLLVCLEGFGLGQEGGEEEGVMIEMKKGERDDIVGYGGKR